MKRFAIILLLALSASAQSIYVTNGTHLVVSNSVNDVKAYTALQMLSMEKNVTNQLFQLAVAQQQAQQEYVQIQMYVRMMIQWGITNPPAALTNAIAATTNKVASTNAVAAPSTNKPSARLEIRGVPVGDPIGSKLQAISFSTAQLPDKPRRTPHIL